MSNLDARGHYTVDPNTQDEIYLSLAKIKFSNTHIGGGFFTGANHSQVYSEYSDNDKSGTLHYGLDNPQGIVASGNFTYQNISGTSAIDTRMWYVEDVPDEAVAIPLLIASSPQDLSGSTVIKAGFPNSSSDPYYGEMYANEGKILSAGTNYYNSTGLAKPGMSGSGLYLMYDTDSDGVDESYVIGSCHTSSYYTTYTNDFYLQLAEDMKSVGVDPDDLPRYVLMSGFDEDSFSHVVYGDYFHEDIIGGSYHDTMFGGEGEDHMLGNDGNDRIDGGRDDDHIEGGSGNDVLLGRHGDDRLFGGDGNDQLWSDIGVDYIYGGDGDDLARAGNGDDVINMGNGNDKVFAGNDNDRVTGGAGDDRIDAGLGNDVVYANAGNDTVIGRGGDDILRTGGGNDAIYGGDGNDRIFDISGHDTIRAEAGDDFVRAGSGHDIVHTGGGNDTVFAGVGNDKVYATTGNNLIYAGSGNDSIEGGADEDRIFGGSGNDYIYGLHGDDVVTGGGGKDVFGFSQESGNDRVTDFQNGIDRIKIADVEMSDLLFRQVDEDAIISYGSNQITLNGFDASELDEDDFVFS